MKPPYWLYVRTRILNVLHWIGIMDAHSQMIEDEKSVLKKHATGKLNALEIGTYMGVSANIIAGVLGHQGKLMCVDPFMPRGRKNQGLAIAMRDFRRNKLLEKVTVVIGFSNDQKIKSKIPDGLDFIFIDGDHSYEGLKNDWSIVRKCLSQYGIVCLHDTIIPSQESRRKFGSVSFFDEVIKNDFEFEVIEKCYSMTVLKRIGPRSV